MHTESRTFRSVDHGTFAARSRDDRLDLTHAIRVVRHRREHRRDLGRAPALAAATLFIIVITVWLRYRAVGASSLWLDDTWVAAGARFPGIVDTIRAGLTSPGFSLTYRAWTVLFGHGATAAQVMALIFGVAGPVTLLVACIERGLPIFASMFGATLFATAPAHIQQSTHLKQ